MKTFDEEYVELVEWCKQSLEEADENIESQQDIGDVAASNIRNEVWHEWNRKLVTLKIKHNIPITEQEEKWRTHEQP